MTPYMRQVTTHLQKCATRLDIPWQQIDKLKFLRSTAVRYRNSLTRECNDSTYENANRDQERIESTIRKVCTDLRLHYYLQPDPRGCCLYVAREPIPDDNYNQVGVMIDAQF